jgi:hypothetical protein
MSTPDFLLIAWWVLGAVTSLTIYALVRWIRYPTATTWSYSADPDRLQAVHAAMPLPLRLTFLVVIVSALVITLAGFLASLWMHLWTALLLLNFQIFMVLFGAGLVAFGLSSELFFFGPWPPLVLRVLDTRLGAYLARIPFILFGLLAIGFGSCWLIGDLAFPRQIVEGRIDGVASYSSLRYGDEYFIVVDGKRYSTLRDVFLAVRAGESVQAEVGAGSKMILRAEPIRAQ